jgi:hypothetical protein
MCNIGKCVAPNCRDIPACGNEIVGPAFKVPRNFYCFATSKYWQGISPTLKLVRTGLISSNILELCLG